MSNFLNGGLCGVSTSNSTFTLYNSISQPSTYSVSRSLTSDQLGTLNSTVSGVALSTGNVCTVISTGSTGSGIKGTSFALFSSNGGLTTRSIVYNITVTCSYGTGQYILVAGVVDQPTIWSNHSFNQNGTSYLPPLLRFYL